MSSKSLTVSIRRDKNVIAEIALSPGSAPVFVGRASDCVLRLPSDDYSASGKHAKIYWKGSSLMIEDAGSRNGIYQDGKVIKRPVKLKPGSLYAIGACLLSVKGEERKKKSKAVSKYHQLEYLNGDNAGRIVDIKPGSDGVDFDIGLDPKCSVHLSDMLVSRRHAILKTHDDGDCWIEDLGSRNGTFVNGERLCGKERLLRDGDTIAVAFFEFKFLDRNVAHTRIQAWVKLAAISVTLCIMAAFYIAWTASRAPVEKCLKHARAAAAASDFASARKYIASSRSARDASAYRQQIDALATQVELWENTRDSWEGVRKKIAEKSHKEALKTLDALVTGPADSWGWNPETMVAVKNEADFAARALHLYFDGTDVITAAANNATPDADKNVREVIGPIESFLNAGKSMQTREYMAQVLGDLDQLLDELKKIRAAYEKIDTYIAKISVDNTSFDEIYSDFKKIADNKSVAAAVRGYARQQLAPCGAFVAAQHFLENELEKLLDLDFAGVRHMSEDFVLPSQEMCIRHVRYSDARAHFLEKHKLYQHEASSLQMMIEGLESVGITMDERGDDINLFLDDANITAALGFDCFKRRPPNARRPEPVGMYDTLFGIEYTYEALRALPNSFNIRNMRSMGFMPRCISARQAFDRAETLVQYLDGEDRKYLQNGKVGTYYTQCLKIASERERLVQKLKDYKGSDRAEIVAAFYSDFFSSSPADVAKRALSQRFAKLKRDVIALGEKYSLETNPEKQLEVREEILATGIPGDPVVHSKWAQKYD